MLQLSKLINKLKPEGTQNLEPADASPPAGERKLKNWYEERYDNVVVQRNILLSLMVVLLILSILTVGVIAYILNTRKFDPFVIQIDDDTGMAKIVNPTAASVLSGNEALAQYFIKRYVIARETYNPVDFNTEARKTVQLLSANNIYWDYRNYLKNEEVNPSITYGQKNTTYLKLKSWSKLSDSKYMMRFSITETGGAQNVFNKLAVVEFQYVPMELTEKQKEINPVGFQVTGYRVDDDSS